MPEKTDLPTDALSFRLSLQCKMCLGAGQLEGAFGAEAAGDDVLIVGRVPTDGGIYFGGEGPVDRRGHAAGM